MPMTKGRSQYNPGGRGSGDWGQRQSSPASLRHSRALESMGSLPDSQNPYARFSGVTDVGDDLSIDDEIISDRSDPPENGVDDEQIFRAMPDPLDVARDFEEFLEAISPVSDVEENAMRTANLRDKWRLIYNQRQRSPIFQVNVYIDHLRQYTNPTKKRWSLRRLSRENMNPLTYWLRKLKLDLSMSPSSFVKKFVSAPNDGIHLLIQVLGDVQSDQAGMSTAAKRAQKEDVKRGLTDEYDTLLCIKFALRVEEAARRLIELNNGVQTAAICVNSTFTKCRIVALNLLSLVCHSEGGYSSVLDSMTHRRMVLGETVRFKKLVEMVNNGSSAYLPFLTACVHFFNTILGLTETPNARVYLQHEIELAGFDPDLLDKYCYGSGFEFDDLQRELESWRQSYLNISAVSGNVQQLQSRTNALREEVDRLQIKLKESEEHEKKKDSEVKEQEEKCNEYRERAAELQDTVEKLRKAYQQHTGEEVRPELHLEEVLKPLDVPDDNKYGSFRSSSSTTASAAPEPPPAPTVPAPPPNYLSQTIRKKVVGNANLPLLNWTPMAHIRNTVFEDMDDEATLREIDFHTFEKQFQLRTKQETEETRKKRERILGVKKTKLSFVDLNRAKNMTITKRKTGLTARQIRDAIDFCEVDVLPGEYAELLIKYIPSKDELKQLAQHASSYKDMGEAEQFLFQLAQVQRLESKLSILAFMGILDELIASLKPPIESVYEASNLVVASEYLPSIFEIILAFGNYMNSSRRGYAVGFRLESLYKVSEIKSPDKATTLLHYLEEYFYKCHPELLHFFEDLDFVVDKGVSYKAILSDIVGLRKGLDLVKIEKEKQPENTRVRDFHNKASKQVADIAELFKRMEESYYEVCCRYGENFRQMEPGVFFGTLTDFAEKYKKVAMENWKKRNPGVPVTEWHKQPRPGVAITAQQVAKARQPLEDELLYDDTLNPDYPGAPPPPPPGRSANIIRRASSRRKTAFSVGSTYNELSFQSESSSRPESRILSSHSSERDPDDILRTSDGSNTNWVLKPSVGNRGSLPAPPEDYYDDSLVSLSPKKPTEHKEPVDDLYDSIPAYEDKPPSRIVSGVMSGDEECYLDLEEETAPALPEPRPKAKEDPPRPRTDTMKAQDTLNELDAMLDDELDYDDYMYMGASNSETEDTEL